VVPEGGARLVNIAASLGRSISFQVAIIGGGIETHYIYVYLPGNSCVGRKKVGRLDRLVVLSDDALRDAMVAAIAPKP